ncbi:MAG: TolC family protein [Bacteroidales bacterium]|jgi:outer membrane protein TolC|nr:TolC family protein [Bacteroidales bacterium]
MKHIFNLLIYFGSLLLLFHGFNLKAQQPLTLEDAVLKGLENNFQIRISEQEYNISRLNNTQGAAGRWPSINVGINSINRYDNTPSFDTSSMSYIRGDQYTNSLTPNVELRWLLFDGFFVSMNKQKLDLLEQYSLGFSTIVVENTLQAIILGYYYALLEQERLKVLKGVKDLSGDRYDYEMLRKDIGTSVTFEVLQAKNSFYSDSTNYLLQELNEKNAFLRLNLLLGEPPEVQFMLVDSFMVNTRHYDLNELMKKMLDNNTNLKNQYVNQEILKKNIGIAKSDLWPSLSMRAGADFTQGWYDWEKNEANTYLYDYYGNFTLSFNLFNGGNARREIQTAKINEQIGTLEILQLEQTLANLLVNQYELFSIRKQLLEVADVNLESAKLNLEIASEKYKNGTINSFNFRDVQLIFLNASSRKLNAIYDLIDSQTELLRLSGGILSQE